MKLSDYNAGDILAIAWPRNDYDSTLAGTEQIVQLGALLGGRKNKRDKPHTAIVVLVDRESMTPRTQIRATRAITPDAVVLALVERSPHSHDDEERGSHHEDASDPLQARRR